MPTSWFRREILGMAEASGIAAERLTLEPASPIAKMFEAYGRVDIALDPYPFAGGATTAQALWMGVPVVSLVGGGPGPGGREPACCMPPASRTGRRRTRPAMSKTARRLAMDRPRAGRPLRA